MSTERIIVERPIADAFIDKLAQRAKGLKVGDPRDPTTAIGPLINQALLMARQLETGMVHIGDQTVNDEPQVPFGGVKGSGYGRMGGKAALDEFTELRWISVQQTRRTFP